MVKKKKKRGKKIKKRNREKSHKGKKIIQGRIHQAFLEAQRESKNERTDVGSRNIADEDSRENAAISKCQR